MSVLCLSHDLVKTGEWRSFSIIRIYIVTYTDNRFLSFLAFAFLSARKLSHDRSSYTAALFQG